jgi:hypothetical protein
VQINGNQPDALDALRKSLGDAAERPPAAETIEKRAGARYDYIAALIWGKGRRTEEHASPRMALQQIDGVHDALIIARASRMA